MKPANQDFPEVKDKIVETVQLSVEAGYYGITIRFQDSTSLSFSVEPCVIAFPVFSEWKDGEEKILKEYQPVRSEASIETETEAGPKEP